MKEKIINFLKVYWIELIYILITVIYLCKLNILNHRLLEQKFGSYIELLAYENNIAIWYFFIALLLFIFGCCLGYKRIKALLKELDNGKDMLVSIIVILIIFVFLILIICFINNPILKAMMSVGLIVFLVTSAK